MNRRSKQKIFIPWRDRGLDPRRPANLDVVTGWWYGHGFEPVLVNDGLEPDQQFNRHKAYNRAVDQNPDIDVFVFAEADMLIHPMQIHLATAHALDKPGLVVPFYQYRYLSDTMTEVVRDSYRDLRTPDLTTWWTRKPTDPKSIFSLTPESTMDNGRSIGAVNVVSRETLDLTGGFTELTSGNWYDDRVIEEGFAFLTRNVTRYVEGPAVHLYHLPGWTGDHLTEEDKKATAHNKEVLDRLRGYIKNRDAEAVKSLLSHRKRVTA